MKEFLGGRRMSTDVEVKETITDCLNGLAADSSDKGFSSLCNVWANA
jgi:hypothetical protein